MALESNFHTFLDKYRSLLSELFTHPLMPEWNTMRWGMPDDLLHPILDQKPLSVFIGEQYGGLGGGIKEGLSVLEASSYESLPLSLMIGINGALFLQPVSCYGTEEAKKEIFTDFLDNRRMGGMMITEPDFGSDALHMQTFFKKEKDKYQISGTKHWAGLTGQADYWLLSAREQVEGNQRLSKDINFFIHPTKKKGVTVLEYYKNLGLRLIPYGRNKIDCEIPINYKLTPRTSGIKMLTDILHRSRLQFPGMAMGFLRRILDTATDHCHDRNVGTKSLMGYDQVKSRLAAIQSQYTVCSAMCAYSTKNAGCDKDLSGSVVVANSIKALVTDYMQEASQSLMQLFGAKGYKIDSWASRSVVDSRPFQIFEGSNDILYQQISEGVCKSMRKLKSKNLYEYLSSYELTSKAAPYFKKDLSFELPASIGQEKLVQLGKVLARVISIDFTLDLDKKGFSADLVKSSVEQVRREVLALLSSFSESMPVNFVEDYRDTRWQNAVA